MQEPPIKNPTNRDSAMFLLGRLEERKQIRKERKLVLLVYGVLMFLIGLFTGLFFWVR